MAAMEENSGNCNSELIAELNQKIARHSNFLTDSNRASRKRGLEGIIKELFSGALSSSSSTVVVVYKSVQVAVTKLIADPVEKCRELAISTVEKYLELTNDYSTVLPAIVPYLVQRLGQQEIIEPSEELRLQLSQLTTKLVCLSEKQNSLYLDDYIKVLQRTLVDPFYEVRKEACKCASILAKSIPEHFHLQSESLIKPLLHSISHQHYKVRVAVINAIGKHIIQ
ncbi:HEATR2 [Bugula neritina]|uniref:HEATR2 n=1 Tax=Bugula neritina TaxID=10212 RepID=A0A7J7J3R9_BUGNE|nr:HEATR2 [Bugula neritina]